jgi:hypothetical protein
MAIAADAASERTNVVPAIADDSRPVSRIIGVQAAAVPHLPERYQRSPELVGELRTAAVHGDDGGRSPVITADAIREVPGDGRQRVAHAAAPAPVPPPPVSAVSTPTTAPAADTPDVADPFGAVLGTGLAALAVLIGLWIRIRQSRRSQARPDGTAHTGDAATISFEQPEPTPAPNGSRLERLIRGELSLIEEPVQFPPRLEFYGWPVGVPLARIDGPHLSDATSRRAALAGPHFLRRSLATVSSGGGPAEDSPGRAEQPARRKSSRPIRTTAVHAAHGPETRPRSRRVATEDAFAAPGPLDRALERLAKNQS